MSELLGSRPKSALSRYAIFAFLITGVVLRLWQYLANSAQWLDEVAVSRNILDRPLGSLLA